MVELTKSSKVLGVLVGIGAVLIALYWLSAGSRAPAVSAAPARVQSKTLAATPGAAVSPGAAASPGAASPRPSTARTPPPGVRPVRIALATWPGHMPLVIANGGLTTAP